MKLKHVKTFELFETEFEIPHFINLDGNIYCFIDFEKSDSRIRIDFIKVNRYDFVNPPPKEFLNDNYEISFSNGGDVELTNEFNSVEVLSNVTHAIKEFSKQYNPKYLSFTISKDSTYLKRKNIYNYIIKKGGYVIVYEDDFEVATTMIVSDNKILEVFDTKTEVDGPYIFDGDEYKKYANENDFDEDYSDDTQYYYFYKPKNNKPKITVLFDLFDKDVYDIDIPSDYEYSNYEFSFVSGDNKNLVPTNEMNSFEVHGNIVNIIKHFNSNFNVENFSYTIKMDKYFEKRSKIYTHMFGKCGFNVVFNEEVAGNNMLYILN